MNIDMSPKAISKRLKQTSELRRLCLALAGSRLGENDRRALSPPFQTTEFISPDRKSAS